MRHCPGTRQRTTLMPVKVRHVWDAPIASRTNITCNQLDGTLTAWATHPQPTPDSSARLRVESRSAGNTGLDPLLARRGKQGLRVLFVVRNLVEPTCGHLINRLQQRRTSGMVGAPNYSLRTSVIDNCPTSSVPAIRAACFVGGTDNTTPCEGVSLMLRRRLSQTSTSLAVGLFLWHSHQSAQRTCRPRQR
jgi:hypothetical protein